MRVCRLALVVLVLMSIFVGSLVQAQDGLSDEQQALFDRVQLLRDKMDDYSSYVEVDTGFDMQSFVINFGGQTLTQFGQENYERTSTIIQQDGAKNVLETSVFSFEKTESQPGQETTLAYDLTAEVRLVDEVIYVNVALVEPVVGAPELPEGWVEVDDPANFEVFDGLDLDNLMDDSGSDLLENEEARQSAVAVISEPGTLDNGSPVEIITIIFDEQVLAIMLQTDETEELDSMAQAMINAVTDFQARLAVTVDADDNPVQVESYMIMQALEIDMNALDPDQFPAGMLLDFVAEKSEAQQFSQFNEPFEPVAAPEELSLAG